MVYELSIDTKIGDLQWPWMAKWPLFCIILPNLVVSGAHCVKVVDKAITMDNLRLLCLVVNICRGTARRLRYKYPITARWKFCSRFINSRRNAQYLPSYRLIFVNEVCSLFWYLEVRVRYRRKQFTFAISYADEFLSLLLSYSSFYVGMDVCVITIIMSFGECKSVTSWSCTFQPLLNVDKYSVVLNLWCSLFSCFLTYCASGNFSNFIRCGILADLLVFSIFAFKTDSICPSFANFELYIVLILRPVAKVFLTNIWVVTDQQLVSYYMVHELCGCCSTVTWRRFTDASCQVYSWKPQQWVVCWRRVWETAESCWD